MYERVERDGVVVHTVPELFRTSGIGIAFSERSGGISLPPYEGLNLAAHVGDDPRAVDVNRARLLEAIGIAALRDSLTCAEQVHGARVVEVTDPLVGAGGGAGEGRAPIAGADALWTRLRGVPLMLMFADCVPVVLARPSVPAIAVVHAGWRGVAAGIAGAAARALAALDGPADLAAFIGPHIGQCCYEVGDECASLFSSTFITNTAASPRLDLGAAVAEDLKRSGVPEERQWHLGICTAHSTDRFFSYRSERGTGRHGALAVVL